MERQRSRSRDSPNACDMTPTRPLSPTAPFLESSSSTPERLTPVERILLEGQEPEGEPDRGLDPHRAWDRDVLRRRDHETEKLRFQTPNSVSFLGLTEFRGANSVSSSQPIICVPKRTHRVFRRTHRVCPETQ